MENSAAEVRNWSMEAALGRKEAAVL